MINFSCCAHFSSFHPTHYRLTSFPDGVVTSVRPALELCRLLTYRAPQFGVFQQHYAVNQLKDLPLSTISWIGALQLSLILLMGCFSGPLFDAGVGL
jgi:hypothetical protein